MNNFDEWKEVDGQVVRAAGKYVAQFLEQHLGTRIQHNYSAREGATQMVGTLEKRGDKFFTVIHGIAYEIPLNPRSTVEILGPGFGIDYYEWY